MSWCRFESNKQGLYIHTDLNGTIHVHKGLYLNWEVPELEWFGNTSEVITKIANDLGYKGKQRAALRRFLNRLTNQHRKVEIARGEKSLKIRGRE